MLMQLKFENHCVESISWNDVGPTWEWGPWSRERAVIKVGRGNMCHLSGCFWHSLTVKPKPRVTAGREVHRWGASEHGISFSVVCWSLSHISLWHSELTFYIFWTCACLALRFAGCNARTMTEIPYKKMVIVDPLVTDSRNLMNWKRKPIFARWKQNSRSRDCLCLNSQLK